jgi:hypothetical protein
MKKTSTKSKAQPRTAGSLERVVIPLRRIKRWPTLKRHLEGRRVRIYSREWMLWWRENGAGYTDVPTEAGVYEFEDAFLRSGHCGPEKGIEYETAV